MPAYLLTWNPDNWSWQNLADTIKAVESGSPVDLRWSCGNTRSIPLGSRVFLLRQSVEPRGIIASGWVTKSPYEDRHWDAERASRGDLAWHIVFSPDAMLNPSVNEPLDVRSLAPGLLSRVNWRTPASGIRIPDDAALDLEDLWTRWHGGLRPALGIIDPELTGLEGETRTRLVKHRSRERHLRNAKIESAITGSRDGRLRCEVPRCDFDFEETYGELGQGYAHVHHLRPLSASDSVIETRLDDLAVVCANCHAMIHQGGQCRPLDGLIPNTEA